MRRSRYTLVSAAHTPSTLTSPPSHLEICRKAAAMQVPPESILHEVCIAVTDNVKGREYVLWTQNQENQDTRSWFPCWNLGMHRNTRPWIRPHLVSPKLLDNLFGDGSSSINTAHVCVLGHPCLRHFVRIWYSTATPVRVFNHPECIIHRQRWPTCRRVRQ